ncbi:MAG: PAS domain-containing protein, partial [Actinomycetota bacterium]|nr:PAS domain-containing protein [Actinomycetota bacterium]
MCSGPFDDQGMGDGKPEGAATPKRARHRRSTSGRLLLIVLAGTLAMGGLEFVIIRTFSNLGEVRKAIPGNTVVVSLRVLDGSVAQLHVLTDGVVSGQTKNVKPLSNQISEVNAELRVATQAVVGSPLHVQEIERIRSAFLAYRKDISPVLKRGPGALFPTAHASFLTEVGRAIDAARLTEDEHSRQYLSQSLEAAQVARGILLALAASVALLGLVAGLWSVRTSRRIREEVGVRGKVEHERDVAEAKYRTLIEHIPAVTYVDRVEPGTGQLVAEYISPQVEQLSGYGLDVWLADAEFWKGILDPRDRAAVLDIDDRNGDTFLHEYRLIARDGRIVWVRDEATLGRPDEEGVRRWQGVMLDVTMQKAADENLRLLESAVVNATDAVMVSSTQVDVGGSIVLFVNPAFERLTGYSAEEFVGTSPGVLLGPNTDMELVEEARRQIAGGNEFRGQNINYRKDRSEYRVDWRTAPIRDETGGITHLVTVMQDITARVEAEERLRDAEERFRTLVEHIPAAAYFDAIEDPDNPLELTPRYISPRIEAISGYPAERWLNDDDFWVDILHPDDRARVMAASQRALDEKTPFSEEYRLIAADGRVVWVAEDSIVMHDEQGRPKHWLGIYVDQTERQTAQQRLEETEAKYRALVEQIPAILYIDIFGPQMPTAYVSPQIEDILGITVEGYLNDPGLWLRHVHPDDREEMRASVQRLAETASDRRPAVQYRMIRPDGAIVWIDDRSSILYDSEGKPAFLQGVMFDITAVKSAEAELTRSRALLAGAEQMAALGSWEHDPASGVTSWSDEMFRIYGLDPSTATASQETFLNVIHPDEIESVSQTILEGLGSGAGYNFEHRILRPDGSERVVHQLARAMKDDVTGSILLSGSVQDVTERREAERERVLNLELLQQADAQRQKLLRHLVDAQEEERERIAGDIHDDPIQKMTAVGMRIETARRRVTELDQIRLLGELSEV